MITDLLYIVAYICFPFVIIHLGLDRSHTYSNLQIYNYNICMCKTFLLCNFTHCNHLITYCLVWPPCHPKETFWLNLLRWFCFSLDFVTSIKFYCYMLNFGLTKLFVFQEGLTLILAEWTMKCKMIELWLLGVCLGVPLDMLVSMSWFNIEVFCVGL